MRRHETDTFQTFNLFDFFQKLGKCNWLLQILAIRIHILTKQHDFDYAVCNKLADLRYDCHRIGYGGGFYDKYLEKHPDLHAIAIAFELQMYRELPFEEHDIKPEKVITEKQVYPIEVNEDFL